MRPDDEARYAEYVAARAVALRRTAFLLCGDWHRAEDLVQSALTSLHTHWHRVRDHASLDAYVRSTLGIVFREVNVQPRDTFPDGRPLPKADRAPGCESDFTVGDGPAEEAYVGTCDVTTLANGSVLVVKHGVTPDGYARAAAMLFRPDGSGLDVESTNQDVVEPVTCVEDATGKHCPIAPITREDPGVPATALGDLLVALEPATR